jgi:hypothetical protein
MLRSISSSSGKSEEETEKAQDKQHKVRIMTKDFLAGVDLQLVRS